jgi:branched-chain amino acid transport system ATP-binding protein
MLSLRDVTVHYGTAEAVRGVTLDVTKDSVVSIIGANGAGKSTILKAISGLVPLSLGEILFQGRKISGMPVDSIVKLGIAHIPEGRGSFPYMSVLANLKIGAFLRKEKREVNEDLDRIYERFPRLKERRNQKAGSLSGGEQQMLAIARAMMSRPRLLLMDEPSLGLAPQIIERLAEVIREIHKDGIAVLLVEQNAGLITNVSDRAYILELGRVIMKGNIAELMANDFVRASFLGG